MEIVDNILSFVATKYVLPLLLMVIQLTFKVLIDEKFTFFNLTLALLEIPITLIYISLALLSAFIIAKGLDYDKVFVFFLISIVFYVISITLSKRSKSNFESSKFKSTIGQGILNYLVAIPIFLISINILQHLANG